MNIFLFFWVTCILILNRCSSLAGVHPPFFFFPFYSKLKVCLRFGRTVSFISQSKRFYYIESPCLSVFLLCRFFVLYISNCSVTEMVDLSLCIQVKELNHYLEAEKSCRTDLEMYVAVLNTQKSVLQEDAEKLRKELHEGTYIIIIIIIMLFTLLH